MGRNYYRDTILVFLILVILEEILELHFQIIHPIYGLKILKNQSDVDCADPFLRLDIHDAFCEPLPMRVDFRCCLEYKVSNTSARAISILM